MLVAVWCLDDRERRAVLTRERERLQLAFAVGQAFHDGRALTNAWREHEANLDASPHPDAELARSDAVIDAALAHIQALRAAALPH